MRKSAAWIALSVSLLLADLGQALALEVGAARVRSYIDEPLVATIPVQVDNIQQRDSLSATLAPETEYVARGLPPLADADDLVVQVVEGGNLEEMLIEIRSLSEVSEPYMGLVLQLTWDGGSQVQEFTLLLDPQPVMAGQEESPQPAMADEQEGKEPMPASLAPPEPAQAVEPEAVETVVQDDEAELRQLAEEMGRTPGITISRDQNADVVIRKVRPDDYLAGKRSGGETVVMRSSSPGSAMTVSEPSFTGDTYGPVAAGETLWRISTKVRPGSDVSMQQVMAAIYAANPQAFEGNYETLKKGAMLSIPTAETMRATEGKPPAVASSSTKTAPTTTSTADADQAPVDDAPVEDLSEEPRPGIWNTPEREVDEAELEKKDGLITRQGKAPAVDAGAADEPQSAAMSADDGQAQDGSEESQVAGAVDYTAMDEPELESPELDAAGMTDSQSEAVLDTEDMASDAEPAAGGEAGENEATAQAEAPAQVEGAEEGEASDVTGNQNTLKLGAAIVLVLLLTYWWYRRRRAREEDASAAYAMPLTDEEQSQEDSSLPKPPTFQSQDEASDSGIIGAASIDDDAGASADSTDPTLEQADTYLSYGLYESAADTLQKGIEAEPHRADLRMKLLETHEAAGNQDDFVAAVQDWDNSGNPPDEAQRSNIEAMGRNVAPGVALFAAGAALGGVTAAGFSDEDEVTETAESSTVGRESSEELPEADFDLDAGSEDFGVSSDFSDDRTDSSSPAAESVSLDLDETSETPADESSIGGSDDLDLPSLDLDLDDKAGTEGSDDADTSVSDDDNSLNFNLDDLDFEKSSPDEPSASESNEKTESQDFADLSLDEDDLDLSLDETPADTSAAEAEATDDSQGEESEYDVKLDLAQAYLDMGEPDLAKGLLDEVVEGGNDTQRANAEKLLQEVDQG